MTNGNYVTNILSDCAKNHPYIPNRFIEYLRNLIDLPSENSSFHQAMSDHPLDTFQKLNELFKDTSSITKLTPDELLTKVDFHKKDLSPERIESVLGELRTIKFLEKNGFVDITPLRGAKEKSADLQATYNKASYSIEVATSIRYASRSMEEDVVRWATCRLNENKLIQLENTANEQRSNKKLFVCILNSERARSIHKPEDYLGMAKDIWAKTDNNPNLHIAIVTGRVTVGHGTADCIHPKLR